MQVINKIADRLLNSFVPKLTAEAHVTCQPSTYPEDCGCTGKHDTGWQKFKLCSQNAQCVVTCGACLPSNAVCG